MEIKFKDKLPVYALEIGEDESVGVTAISLVDKPAIEKQWQAFNNTLQRFAAGDKEKRIISGAAMIANLPIYRRDNTKGEYYVIFSPATIEKIAHRFFKKGFTSAANIQHSLPADGVYIIESFLIDSKRGMLTPKGYDELPDGSWFVSMKVENDTIWNDFIKTGSLTGFSVEGSFIEAHLGDAEDEAIKKLIQILDNN